MAKKPFRKNASRYAIRHAALTLLGFDTYDAYLASELWATIRTRILARDGHKCLACGKKAHSVHHVTYAKSVMSGQDDAQLMSICRGCHKAIEFTGTTKLVHTTDINLKLRKRTVRIKTGLMHSKGVRKFLNPRCRCCLKQYKKLGRADICMVCYRSGRATAFVAANPT